MSWGEVRAVTTRRGGAKGELLRLGLKGSVAEGSSSFGLWSA